MQGTSGVYQLNSASCPGTFADNPAAGQKQLLATHQGSGGVKSLSFSTPGTVRHPLPYNILANDFMTTL